ncbi:KRI1-like protein [Cryptotermes secundus]|nr:KRI1-like protein [Cryptotermes secundus]
MWGGLFQKRHKTQADVEKEEEDYKEWLKGQREELSDKKTESELKYLHDYWNNPSLNSQELFLKDYILNKRFLEASEDDDYVPTYDEIVHDSDENLSEDEKTIEKQEEFEHKFNFRFEEPDKEFVKRYPRTMANSLRKCDDRRKKKRREVKERKEAEEARKREELKRLKALKRKEIMEKIEKLKQITGNDEVGFKDEDLEGDFDPHEHDKRMRQIFNCEYYNGDEREKPEFPELDEELEIENWDAWNGRNNEMESQQNEYEPHCEDPDFNMDCDYNPANQLHSEFIQAASRKKKGKKKGSKFAQVVANKKPVFDFNSQTFDQYIDEYYKLDFEDIIGDMPCRFKYRNVIPNSFGLSIDEILKAEDKELNQWCSLKKAVQYRPEHVEKYDIHAYNRKSKSENLKRKIFSSLYSEELSEQQTENEETKSKRKRKHKKEVNSCSSDDVELHDDVKKKNVVHNCSVQSSGTGEAEGLSVDNKKRLISSHDSNDIQNEQSSNTQKEKKKKKRKIRSEESNEFSHVTHVETLSVPLLPKKHNSKNACGKRIQKVSWQSDQSKKQENPAISDARLRAYGINPKKYKNKLKYGNN